MVGVLSWYWTLKAKNWYHFIVPIWYFVPMFLLHFLGIIDFNSNAFLLMTSSLCFRSSLLPKNMLFHSQVIHNSNFNPSSPSSSVSLMQFQYLFTYWIIFVVYIISFIHKTALFSWFSSSLLPKTCYFTIKSFTIANLNLPLPSSQVIIVFSFDMCFLMGLFSWFLFFRLSFLAKNNAYLTVESSTMAVLTSTSTTTELPPDCLTSSYGCCPDEYTAAHGPNDEGCCLSSPFGCCPDHITESQGPNLQGDGHVHLCCVALPS